MILIDLFNQYQCYDQRQFDELDTVYLISCNKFKHILTAYLVSSFRNNEKHFRLKDKKEKQKRILEVFCLKANSNFSLS